MRMGHIKRTLLAAAFTGYAGIAVAGGRPLIANLDGLNEVPPAGADVGFASLTLNQGRGEVCFDIETDVDGIAAAHIHSGVAGTNGPVVVNLDFPTNGLSGCVSGVGKALIKEIRQHPDMYYVNVHNGEFPGGAIRGQLEK